MSIERLDFENITEADIQELLTAQVPEGLRLEYKRDNYGASDGDKRELLKDVSALANAQGGHLIIGIDEAEGTPSDINGVLLQDRDADLIRIDQIIQNGLDPRIKDIRSRTVNLANGNCCIVIRVPKSWQPPHRVIATGVNRFYIRNERNVSEPNMQELRILFTKGQDIVKTARQYRDERLEIILSGRGPRELVAGGRLIAHIIPFASLSSDFQVDIRAIEDVVGNFMPFGAAGMSPRYNFDGYIIGRGGEENKGYTQVFRNGIVEITKAPISHQGRAGNQVIPSIGFERHIFERLPLYFAGLQSIGVPPPFVVTFVLEGVDGCTYAIPMGDFDDPTSPINRNILYLPECLVENYGDAVTYHKAVKPAFDALWNASEFPEARSFNQDGLWVGLPR